MSGGYGLTWPGKTTQTIAGRQQLHILSLNFGFKGPPMKNILASILFLTVLDGAFAQQVGLQLYSLREQFKKDVPATMAKVKSWDVKLVEVHSTYGLSTEDFKKLLNQNGLSVISVGGEFKDLQTDPMKVVGLAKALGATYVMCSWIPHKGNDFTFDDARRAVDVFNTAGKLLKENGLALCYHPHGYEIRPYQGGTLFDYLVKGLNADYVNFEMDVFWVKHAGRDPVALLKKYPKRFPLMHLKDRKPGTPGNQNGSADVETNVVLGAGDVGIAAVMKAAKEMGVKYAFLEDESSRSEQQIPLSLAFLKGLR
jgi:sugar phosphate isomerase/epimerase